MRHRTLMIATLTALLAGCGGGGGTEDQPKQTVADWSLSYATCMREHGIDMPDPKPGEGLALPMGGPGMEATVEASDACRAELGDPPVAEGEQPTDRELQERQLKLVQCLREHGVDVPDPQPGQGIGLDLSWPAEALQACGIPVPGES